MQLRRLVLAALGSILIVAFAIILIYPLLSQMEVTKEDNTQKFEEVTRTVNSHYTVHSKNIISMEPKKVVYGLVGNNGINGSFSLMVSETEQGIICSFLSSSKSGEWIVKDPQNVVDKISKLGK